jgi:hypothetical protein
MHQSPIPELSTLTHVRDHCRMLAGLEAGDGGFLSCYLDLRAGMAACREFVARRAHALRAGLRGAALADFERTLRLLNAELQRPPHPDASGLAVFARAASDTPSLSALQVAVAFESDMSYYRVPAIAPLLALDVLEQRFALLLVRDAGMQVLDVDLGQVMPRAWAAWPQSAGSGLLDRRGLLLRSTLGAADAVPLVVGGEPQRIAEVLPRVPGRATARLAGTVQVPSHLPQRDAVLRVMGRLAEERRASSALLVGRLLRALQSGGQAVAGPLATFDALCAGAADSLVAAADSTPSARWVCDSCGGAASAPTPARRCPSCGQLGLREWQGMSELVRLATQRGVRVELVNSDELRHLGGVGCLLRAPAEPLAMPEPAAGRRLDLVA